MSTRHAIVFGLLLLLGGAFFVLLTGYAPDESLNRSALYYAENTAAETGAQNIVAAIIVTYRGLDTLGEVTVLFLTAAIIGLVLSNLRAPRCGPTSGVLPAGELLNTGARLLVPLIALFGAYVFVNGHLTPGGGFQGGVVIASAVVLLLMANSEMHMKHGLLNMIEALSGATYVAIGLLGMWLAAGFLDPRFLPSGEFGALFSAGAIPLIYSLIGMKVGSELTGVMESLRRKA